MNGRFLAVGRLAAVLLIAVAAPAFGSGNNCVFQAHGLSMGFGALDPSSGGNVNVTVQASTLNANKWGDCAPGQSMSLSADNGLNFSGSRRLKRVGSSDFIAYSLSALPTGVAGPSNGIYQTFTFNGAVLGASYANAPAGNYSDTVVISVTP
jgi:spore coat protein U-like protein